MDATRLRAACSSGQVERLVLSDGCRGLQASASSRGPASDLMALLHVVSRLVVAVSPCRAFAGAPVGGRAVAVRGRGWLLGARVGPLESVCLAGARATGRWREMGAACGLRAGCAARGERAAGTRALADGLLKRLQVGVAALVGRSPPLEMPEMQDTVRSGAGARRMRFAATGEAIPSSGTCARWAAGHAGPPSAGTTLARWDAGTPPPCQLLSARTPGGPPAKSFLAGASRCIGSGTRAHWLAGSGTGSGSGSLSAPARTHARLPCPALPALHCTAQHGSPGHLVRLSALSACHSLHRRALEASASLRARPVTQSPAPAPLKSLLLPPRMVFRFLYIKSYLTASARDHPQLP